jgi:tetratricopeptide (TPR) repeat protein
MKSFSLEMRPLRRLIWALALVVGLTLSVGACSGASSNSPAENAKLASAALDAGLKAHAAGDLATASADYATVQKYDPKNKFAFYNLALIDEAETNYGLATTKYRSALDTDAAYEPALFNLAILRTPADPKEAIALYKRAVAANPKDAAALLNLGLLLRANGDKANGDKDVLKAIVMNPRLQDPAGGAKPSGSSTKPKS